MLTQGGSRDQASAGHSRYRAQPMRLREPSEIRLPVADPARSRGFYADVLGFKSAAGGALWMGEVRLALVRGTPLNSPAFVVAFRVDTRDEVEAWATALRRRGIRVATSADRPDARAVTFADPDGHAIEIAFEAPLGLTEPNPLPPDER